MTARLSFSLMIVLCSIASAFAAGEYRTVEVQSLRITMDSEWALQSAPGYVPVRFDIANLGDERVIEIGARGERWFMYAGTTAGSLDLQQTLRLKRGDRLRLTIAVPAFADNENFQFEIREGSRVLQTFNYYGFQSGKSLEESPVLIVADQASPHWTMAGSLPRTVTGPYYRTVTSAPKLDFILEPSRLPSNWLGFTSLRAVLLGPTEWEQLSEPQRNALLAWTACGGDLMLVDGELKTLFPGKQFDGPAVRYFFGHIHFPKSEDLSQKGLAAALSDARAIVQESSWALPANRAPDWGRIAERGFRLPIPGVDGAPTRMYLWILMLFAVLIGPVNYIFLWRKRLQTLLVLTVPLISGLFIAVLAGYAIAGEGFGVRGRAETFTVLDQVSKQAATRASVSLYAAGMAPAGGLRFARDLAVYPIGSDGRGSRDQISMDLSESQRFASGIIRARSPSNFEQAGFRPARERLNFETNGERVNVVNGLGATITQLVYRDHGKFYALSGRLQAGEKGVLQTGLWKGPETGLSDSAMPRPAHSEKFLAAFASQADGSYLAVLDRSPFWDPGTPDIDERGSFHLVLGYTGGEP